MYFVVTLYMDTIRVTDIIKFTANFHGKLVSYIFACIRTDIVTKVELMCTRGVPISNLSVFQYII